MRRGFSRGGGSRSGGSRSGRAKPGSARAQSGRGRQPAKGQVKGGKAVQYAIESKTGETKYIGSTNNPRRRAAQHRERGKMGPTDKLRVQSPVVPRSKAERLESGRLKGHRQEHGRNPRHNKTKDGQFHRPKE